MAINLRHATLAQLGAAWRERFRSASGIEAYRLARWIMARIADGTVTETQVRNFLGMTAAQWTTAKAKYQDWAAKYDAMQAAGGD